MRKRILAVLFVSASAFVSCGKSPPSQSDSGGIGMDGIVHPDAAVTDPVVQAQLAELSQLASQGYVISKDLEDFLVSRRPGPVYKVQVDPIIPFEVMIAAGNYYEVDSSINKKNFPIERGPSRQVELRLVHFDREITTDRILAELDRRNLRPATLPELLALGADYRDLQWQIVALGSRHHNSFGEDYWPVLARRGPTRILTLIRADLRKTEWDDVYRFLVKQ